MAHVAGHRIAGDYTPKSGILTPQAVSGLDNPQLRDYVYITQNSRRDRHKLPRYQGSDMEAQALNPEPLGARGTSPGGTKLSGRDIVALGGQVKLATLLSCIAFTVARPCLRETRMP